MLIRPALSARRTRLLSGAAGVATTLVVGALLTSVGLVLPQSASASSAITVTAKSADKYIDTAPLPDLAVTVSQTTDLVSQGILVSWTGGRKSTVPGSEIGGTNFLQIAQCWGDDPDNPGQPDRTTCQYGGFGSPGATRDGAVSNDALVAREDAKYTAPSTHFSRPTYTSIPFKSVTGKVIESVVDNKALPIDINQNEFFTLNTSNEVRWAGSGANGEGSARFEIQTAQQAPGLGCGTPVISASKAVTGQSCWLVVIPRGTADPGESNIIRPGLFWDNWKHKLAFKLDFKPLGVTCTIGAAERQVAGSELIGTAVASWQPKLCNSTGGAIFTISTGTESVAMVAASGTATAPLALTSRPLATEAGADPMVYAPIGLSGAAISFAVDREPNAADGTPAEAIERAGLPFTEMKLTPRLVAKLLTNSYLASLPLRAPKAHLGYKSAAEPGHNPQNLTFDPDFLAINDAEWANQSISSPGLSDLLEPQGRSDVAWQLWRYVLADKDAVAFLDGTPDPWGMIVNPWSSTSADVNLSGAALELPRDNFPKADPAEQPGTEAPKTDSVNVVTWRPYTNDFDHGAYLTLRGDGQVLGPWDPAPSSGPAKYTKAARNLVGQQRVIGLTDTASAAKYQVLTASLLTAAGTYVAPTVDSLTAGAAAMTATAGQPAVYEYDPAGEKAKGAPTAYPLTMPVYASASPSMTDAAVRADYATFIRYAATDGQISGTTSGQLPSGYAPIPDGWRVSALAAADSLQGGVAVAAQTPAGTAAAPASVSSASGVLPPLAEATAASSPQAGGEIAGAILGPNTPKDTGLGPIGAAVPISLLSGFAAAFAVPFLTRIKRRV